MATGYTRQSSSHIVNGEIITAPPLNNEFNAIVATMDAVDGHAHDGSEGNAPPINLTTSVSDILPNAHGGVGWKHNTESELNPTSTDDEDSDYGPGSIWINTTDARVYVCVDGTTNAAVWREVLGVFNNQLLPHATATVDLGISNRRYRDLFLSRKLTVPNMSATKFSGQVNMDSNKVTNVGAPTSNADAATKSYVDTSIASLIASAPGALDTLKELADAIGNDANFATTMTNSLNSKLSLSGGTMSGVLNMGTNRIANVSAPSQGSDAANKQYVDAVIGTAAAAQQSANAAASSANSAANSANAAAGSEAQANTHRQTANSRANAANQSANEAAGSANAAQQSLDDAEDARDLAKDWANKTGSPVAGGEYSSKHYAGISDNWANAPVDQQIAPGKYSGLHWATKAQNSSGYAPNPASNPNKYLYSTPSDYTFKTAQDVVNESYSQGSVTLRSASSIRNNTSGDIALHFQDSSGTNRSSVYYHISSDTTRLYNRNSNGGVNGYVAVGGSGSNDLKFQSWTVYHSGNTGSGSGMDADLLDGQHGSYYRNASNLNSGTISNARLSGNYSFGNLTLSGKLTSTGLDLGSSSASTVTDMSRHITLNGSGSSGYGFSVTNSNLNYNANVNHTFYTGGEMIVRFNNLGHANFQGYVNAVGLTGEGSGITNLNANNVSSGTLNANRVPNLNANKIAAGTLDAARIPNLNASKLTTGTLADARIPNLNASKITTGTLNANRLPNLNASILTAGTLPSARLNGNYSFGSLTLSGALSVSGNVNSGGFSSANAAFIAGSANSNNIISTWSGSGRAGHIFIRPRGVSDTTNQSLFHNDGRLIIYDSGVQTSGLHIGTTQSNSILRNTNNSWIALAGGTEYNVASNVLCYGPNSNNGEGRLRYDGSSKLVWDSSTVLVDNGGSGLHIVSTVESASGTGHTAFTIGTALFVNNTSKLSRRDSMTVRLDAGNDSHYRGGGSGSVLSGTWRQCGERGGATDQNLMHRVA